MNLDEWSRSFFHNWRNGSSEGKESVCLQCRRPGFDPWARKIPWRRKWQSTPVLLPGKSHGQRSLADYSPWDRKESDPTERLHFTWFNLYPQTHGSLRKLSDSPNMCLCCHLVLISQLLKGKNRKLCNSKNFRISNSIKAFCG